MGVDACKRGWIAIAVEDDRTGAYFAEDIQMLIAQAEAEGPLAVVAVDMPIGLPDRGHCWSTCRRRRCPRCGCRRLGGTTGPVWPR
jgi:predicted RNase H-like nuclease